MFFYVCKVFFSGFLQLKVILSLVKITQNTLTVLLSAFDLKFSGLLGLTVLIVTNKGICRRVLRIRVIKINPAFSNFAKSVTARHLFTSECKYKDIFCFELYLFSSE